LSTAKAWLRSATLSLRSNAAAFQRIAPRIRSFSFFVPHARSLGWRITGERNGNENGERVQGARLIPGKSRFILRASRSAPYEKLSLPSPETARSRALVTVSPSSSRTPNRLYAQPPTTCPHHLVKRRRIFRARLFLRRRPVRDASFCSARPASAKARRPNSWRGSSAPASFPPATYSAWPNGRRITKDAGHREALEYMKGGKLVPDATVVALVEERKPCLRCAAASSSTVFPAPFSRPRSSTGFCGRTSSPRRGSQL